MGFEPHFPQEKRTPPVWGWYVFLCALMALSHFALIWVGYWLITNARELSMESRQPPDIMVAYGVFLIVAGLFMGIANTILPFLPKKPWIYVLHMVNIVAAALTGCCLPLAVPVFIFWLKQDLKDLFEFR